MSPQTLAPELQETPLVNAENPWPGLAPFDEAQAEYFYGREREVEDLFRRVRLNLLSVLYGQSGLGKTSLVRAALFPKLRGNGMLPVPIRLDYTDESPPARSQIWQAFAAAMKQAGKPAPVLAEDQTLWEYFHHRSLELGFVPVLVFDQFEELFTLGPERRGGAGFMRDCLGELAALIENRPPDRVEARFDREPKLVAQYDFDRRDYRMLVSLREDYLAHLHDLSGKIPSITLNNMRLTPLDGSRALEAVEKPGGKLVAPGAAEAIVRVVAGAREERAGGRVGALGITDEHERHVEVTPLEDLIVDPSLLSLLCRELNQKRRDERVAAITPELVEKNRENILNNFYERCLAGLPEGVQVFIEEDLLTETGFRETLNVDNAESKLRQHGADPRALTVLVNRRLLHYEQRGASTRVELTHDVLAPVVRQSRTLRREREAIREGEARKRRELEESERAAQAARAEAEAKLQQSRRQRRAVMAFGVAMAAVAAVAVFTTFMARRATRRANEATATAEQATRKAEAAGTENARLVGSLSESNDALNKKQDSLVRAKDAAVQQQKVADAMLIDFCGYALRVINRFGDSTKGNADLTRAFNTLVELSDTSVDRMIRTRPDEVCPRQLDARILSVSTGLQLELQDTVKAVERGRLGLEASRHLLQWAQHDSLSKAVAAKSFGDLNYSLYFAGNDSLSLAAAHEALRLNSTSDAAHDHLAYDARARLYHYGALSLIRMNRPDLADRWVDSGLVVTTEGRRRADQNQVALLYTVSQLYLRRVEIDTLRKQPTEALAANRLAIQATRERLKTLHNVSTHTWHAKMYGWYGDLARRLGQYSEGLTAHDSASTQWEMFLREVGMADTTDAADALDGIGSNEYGKSLAEWGLGRFPDALRYANSYLDTTAALVRLRGSLPNRHKYARAFLWKGDVLEQLKQPAAADSAYRTGFRVDSVIFAASARSDNATQAQAADWLAQSAGGIATALQARAAADTAGKPLEQRQQILRAGEEAARRFQEAEVLARRREREVFPAGARARGDSLLASALGNLGWLYLLVDRPEAGVDASGEAMRLDPHQTYILPNYYNALILSGRDEDAAAFFKSNETRLVESSPEVFACAVVRDIRVLRVRGIATDRHVTVTEQLAAADLGKCRHKL